MRDIRSLTALIRPSTTARALAVFAMLLQAVFAASHISAGAIRGTGTTVPGAKLGFLEICTGSGIVRVPLGSNGAGGDRGAVCSVCASACVAGFDEPALIPDLFPNAVLEGNVHTVLAGIHTAGSRSLSDGPIRAPPAFLI